MHLLLVAMHFLLGLLQDVFLSEVSMQDTALGELRKVYLSISFAPGSPSHRFLCPPLPPEVIRR